MNDGQPHEHVLLSKTLGDEHPAAPGAGHSQVHVESLRTFPAGQEMLHEQEQVFESKVNGA